MTKIKNRGVSLNIKGKKECSVKDVVVEERNVKGEVHWAKALPLEKGFSIGASVYREPKLTGFGLWAELDKGRSFSWEWFDVEKPGFFRKRQEGGAVTVTCQGLPIVEEIASIHFDTDISLRINNSNEVGKDTHRVLIRKGSVLRFSP